jgi:ATPase family associated with various cellular activities (AAA)
LTVDLETFVHPAFRYSDPVQVTLNTAKRILERLLLSHDAPPVYLEGAPGVGKSAIVHQVAATLDLTVLDVRAAYLTPPDLIGLPALERDSGRTTYYLPEFLPEPLTKGILVLEELPSAAPAIQVALYQLLLDRRVGWRYELPPGWRVVATGNRLEDGYTHPLSNAMATRLLRLEIRADLGEFTAYAVQHGVHPMVTAFVTRHPNLLHQPLETSPHHPNPRTWTMASAVLRAFGDDLDSMDLEPALSGVLGDGTARAFTAFLKLVAFVPDVEDILERGAMPRSIPRLAERPDIVYAYANALVSALGHKVTPARVRNFARAIADLEVEAAMLAARLALKLRGVDTILAGVPEWKAFYARHSAVLG